MNIWRTLLAWLASLSSDPTELDRARPRAAAAAAAAYAEFGPDQPQEVTEPRCENGECEAPLVEAPHE